MRAAKYISFTSAIASLALFTWHFLDLPSGASCGWLFDHRYEKEAIYEVSGKAYDEHSWSSRFGTNRPKSDWSHRKLSELEVTVEHVDRDQAGFVSVKIVADSKDEVDSFIYTLTNDVARTYTKKEPGILKEHPRAQYHTTFDMDQPTIYWRQRYLFVLVGNFGILIMIWIFLLQRESKQQNPKDRFGP